MRAGRVQGRVHKRECRGGHKEGARREAAKDQGVRESWEGRGQEGGRA